MTVKALVNNHLRNSKGYTHGLNFRTYMVGLLLTDWHDKCQKSLSLLCVVGICHFKNKRELELKCSLNNIVSVIVTGVMWVTCWPVFLPVPSNSPKRLCESLLRPVSLLPKWEKLSLLGLFQTLCYCCAKLARLQHDTIAWLAWFQTSNLIHTMRVEWNCCCQKQTQK